MTDPLRKSPEGLNPSEHLNPLDQSNNEALNQVETENQEVIHVGAEVDSDSSEDEADDQSIVEQPTSSVEAVLETQAVLETVSDSDAHDKIMTEHLLKDSAGLDNAAAAHKLLLDIMNPEA